MEIFFLFSHLSSFGHRNSSPSKKYFNVLFYNKYSIL
nr:MAG TPA: hypothetical protein [Caudoviricetes sp.]